MRTYCPQLWDGYYINRAGDAYPCCHQNPFPVGNIRASHLREIVSSPSAIRARELSLSGSLGCFSSCTLLRPGVAMEPESRSTSVLYAGLRRLHVSFAEACNIRCTMCAHPARHRAAPIVLDARTLVDHIDLAPFEEVVLQGGEPLYIPECRRYMEHLGQVGKRYTLLTNGLLIDNATALQLARDARVISISINGATKVTHEQVNRGSRFEAVLQSIQRLRAARNSMRTDLIISGRMTLTAENLHEIPLFLRTYRTMGFDRANFGFVRGVVPAALARDPALRAELVREVEGALGEPELQEVDPLRLHQLGIWKGKSGSPSTPLLRYNSDGMTPSDG